MVASHRTKIPFVANRALREDFDVSEFATSRFSPTPTVLGTDDGILFLNLITALSSFFSFALLFALVFLFDFNSCCPCCATTALVVLILYATIHNHFTTKGISKKL